MARAKEFFGSADACLSPEVKTTRKNPNDLSSRGEPLYDRHRKSIRYQKL